MVYTTPLQWTPSNTFRLTIKNVTRLGTGPKSAAVLSLPCYYAYSDLISFGIYCSASCFRTLDEVPIWKATTDNPQILSQNAFHLNDIAKGRIEDWSNATLFRVCLLRRNSAYGSLQVDFQSVGGTDCVSTGRRRSHVLRLEGKDRRLQVLSE